VEVTEVDQCDQPTLSQVLSCEQKTKELAKWLDVYKEQFGKEKVVEVNEVDQCEQATLQFN
jgi:hypothetical protein